MLTGFVLLFVHRAMDPVQVMPDNITCPEPVPCDISDPSLWTNEDLIGLFSFCSDQNPWPRPDLDTLVDNNTSTHRRGLSNNLPVKLDPTYRLSNKAWSNRANGFVKTKFTTEEVVLLDGFDTTKAKVRSYTQANNGTIVIGYLSVGSYEDWRSDTAKWPDACIGSEYDGWAGENWLPANKWEQIKPVMLARLKMLRDKGFHGYEGDNIGLLDQYTTGDLRDRNMQNVVNYAIWLADTAHRMGLVAVLKNAPYLVDKVVDYYDAVILESAVQYNELGAFEKFAQQKKPIWAFEYSGSVETIGRKAKQSHINADVQLETSKGWRRVV